MTAPFTNQGDPYYERGAPRWHRTLVSGLWGIEVMIDDHLIDHAAVHPDGAIWIKPGLPDKTLHWLLTQATLYFGYGPEAAPLEPITPHLIPTPH